MRSILLAILLGSLGIGCAPQSALMDYRDLSDDKLIQRYYENETSIEATREELTKQAESGRVVMSGVQQNRLTDLKKEQAKITREIRRRGLKVEPANGPQ